MDKAIMLTAVILIATPFIVMTLAIGYFMDDKDEEDKTI